MENTPENFAVEPEKHSAQLDSSKVTSYNNEDNHKTASVPRMRGVAYLVSSYLLETDLAKI